MAAHRYWRLQSKTVNGDGNLITSIGELQMHDSIGGSNVVSGGTPISSTVFSSGYPLSAAFDGNTTDASRWASSSRSSTTAFDWIGYDFGAGNAKDIIEIVIFCPASSSGCIGQMPITFNWQYSDDGVSWITQRSTAIDIVASPWAYLTSKIIDVRPVGSIDIHNYALMSKLRMHQYVTPGQPSAPIYDPNTEAGQLMIGDRMRYYTDMAHGGNYKIEGTTTSLTIPAARRVRLYYQADGRIYAEAYTGQDGAFSFKNLAIGPWTVVGVDDTGAQNGVIYSHVSAVPM